MDKAAEAFRTISEVAEEIGIAKHVLRFWEVKFGHIRPMKRGGGRRYYRPEDLELLKGIRHLLHLDGYTIKGVQKILREQGLEAVKAFGREGQATSSAPAPQTTAFIVPTPPLSTPSKQKKVRAAKPTAVVVQDAASPAAAIKPNERPTLAHSDLRAMLSSLEECRTILRATFVSPAA